MSHRPFLSVVIPAYNEENRITPTLRAVEKFLSNQTYPSEILIVDDGSRDRTKQVVEQLKIDSLHVISYGGNRGKGYAINFGVRHANGRWILFADADNSTPINQLPKLLAATERGKVVIGSRYLPDSSITIRQPLIRVILSRIGNLMTQLLLLPGIRDTQCGFKLFSADVIKPIFERQTIWGWGFDMELLRIAKEQREKIIEVPVIWVNDEHSRLQSSRAFIGTFVELLRIKRNSLLGRYKSSDQRGEPELLTRFAFVGAIGTALDFFVLNLTHGWLGLPLLVGLTLGFTAGAINNYLMNSLWSFGQRTSWVKFTQFFLIATGGLLLNNLIVSVAVHTFGWNYNVGKVVAVIVVFIWTYGLNRLTTFRRS